MNPTLSLARVILFTTRMDDLTAYYRDILGLPVLKGSAAEGWVEFEGLALHRGRPQPGSTKIAFRAGNVAGAREEAVRRGAKFGKIKKFEGLVLCDGRDPDGNPVQISSRA
jgi:catechol 2,3-dioxygenase-like lactoylglutathione lyase family enzyme